MSESTDSTRSHSKRLVSGLACRRSGSQTLNNPAHLAAHLRVHAARELHDLSSSRVSVSVCHHGRNRVRGTHSPADSVQSSICLRHGGRFRLARSGSLWPDHQLACGMTAGSSERDPVVKR